MRSSSTSGLERGRSGGLLALLGVLLCATSLGQGLAAGAAKATIPDRFPGVVAAKDSAPVYGAVAMDTWHGKVAYLMFDGTAKSGYSRAFAWIPDDRQYGRPVELKLSKETGQYTPIQMSSTGESEKSEVVWQFSQVLRSGGGGTHTQTDYVTGKTSTRTTQAWSAYEIRFAASVAAGPKVLASGTGGKAPLDLTVSGELGGQEWEKAAKSSGFAPWESLHVRLGRTASHGKGKAKVLFKLTNLYYGNWAVTVRALPADPDVTLVVAPWMQAPIYSNAASVGSLMREGVEVEMPYGWYTFGCTAIPCWKFVYGVHSPDVGAWPYPFSKPAGQP